MSKNLKRIIKKHILKDAEAELAVADAKLGKLLKVSERNINNISCLPFNTLFFLFFSKKKKVIVFCFFLQ